MMLRILTGDALAKLRELPDESVQCCITSPPYWGLRDYGNGDQLGLEKTPDEYVAKMVEVFREVRRVLRRDGTLWLNLGDSYAGAPVGTFNGGGFKDSSARTGGRDLSGIEGGSRRSKVVDGLKPKDLCGIPWRVAFALQADGWWLRSDIIWAKPNPMPESVTDRPTKAHEYLFLLTKASSYHYDAEAIKEKALWADDPRADQGHIDYDGKRNGADGQGQRAFCSIDSSGRNKRSVWTVATHPYSGCHFATFPPDLIKPCIMAGTSAKGCCAKCGAPWERVVERDRKNRTELDKGDPRYRPNTYSGAYADINGRGDAGYTEVKTLGWQPSCKHDASVGIQPCTVLDPFGGSGTTGMVALELGRKAILIELNPKYVTLIEQRCNVTLGLPL